ncbi:translation initiation factor 5B [Strigomonas culicis]|uniref:Eukaryotic translation initiation factor 5B n=1 Tax=Strigomonas culicis TaxID=28005 RepID=S9TSB8_9TRYP|nr:translation initiation factor 5B [Strigomonas culicis]|eukprot:EPY19464.1 translation initiation factor 5B [Strigomonas culicis]
MHGLEQQTKESLRLLRERKCPFIVALNKVDRLYGWEAHPNMDIQQTLALQNRHVQVEFRNRLQDVCNELSGEGFNSSAYFENKDVRSYVSIVPLSAKTGEGISDLLLLKIKLVKRFMEGKVTYKNDIQCTVLEVKPIAGHGVTIDVILINGVLREGDPICLCGQEGPIFTSIRYLMTPEPMHETRVRGDYVHHREVKAAMGVKIVANELENVVAGTPLIVVKPGDDREAIGRAVMKDATDISKYITADCGVTVQSSTLGALEALLSFLTDMKIPIANAFIGPMHKKHILQVVPMKRRNARYSVVLAFDTVISPDAREVAQKNEIRIFEADIIYHLFDAFTRYQEDFEKQEKDRLRSIAIFPVQLKVLDDAIHHTDPIILPVVVERGQMREGTPLCALKGEDIVPIGRVISMERDNKEVRSAKAGEEIAVKIHSAATGVAFGRHFDAKCQIVSQITRPSVDAVKTFSNELTGDDVNLLATLIKALKVPKAA